MGFEGVGGGEALLVAEPDEVGDPELLVVEVGLEIEEVDFEGVGAVGGEGGALAEVHDGAVFGEVSGDAGAGGVDSARREELRDFGEVGGGEADGAAPFLAVDDFADDGVGAAEEAGGVVEAALEDGLADAGAADDLAIKLDGRDGLDDEAVGLGQLGEARGVALAVAAEGPVDADGDLLEVGENAGDFIDEGGGGEFAQGGVEFDGDDGDGALRAHVGDFLFAGGEARRDAVGGDDGEWVGLEGERGDFAFEAADDGLMAEVDAIKDADGEAGDAGMRIEFGEGDGADEHRGDFEGITELTKFLRGRGMTKFPNGRNY